MAQTSELKTIITADNSQFNAKIKESAIAAKEFGSSLTESFEKAKGLFIGGILGREALLQLREGYESIDRMVASSEKLGISSNSFQALQYAAKRTNVEMGDLDNSIKKLRLSLSRSGSEDALSSLGLSRNSLNAMGTSQAFETVITSLGKLSESAQVDIGTKLFGRNFQQILNLVHGNLQQLKQDFTDLGGPVDFSGFEEADRRVKDLDIKMEQLKQKAFLLFGAPAVGIASGVLNTASDASSIFGNVLNLNKAFSLPSSSGGSTSQTGNWLGLDKLPESFLKNSSNLARGDAGTSAGQAGAQVLKLADASSAAAEALKSLKQQSASMNLKDFLGLGGQGGKEYLSSILKPVTEIQDQTFTDLANEIRNNVQNGIPNNSVSTQSDLAQLKAIANSYNGIGDGQSNSGMQNSVSELTKLVNKTVDQQQKVVIELKYDQDGIVTAVINSSTFGQVAGDIVQSVAAKEAASTIASRG